MPVNLSSVNNYWSEYTEKYGEKNIGLSWWEAGPELFRYINRKVSGSPEIDWVTHTVRKYYKDNPSHKRFLSLGCGDGHLERNLAQHRVFQYMDAYDIANGSIQKAIELATASGIENINYQVTDVNKIALPSCHYDAVWAASAFHHFEALEHIFHQLRLSLKPNGLLILNEYIGPNRFQFSARQKEVSNLCLRLLPEKYRRIHPEIIAQEIERSPSRKGSRWVLRRIVQKISDGDFFGVIQRRIAAYQNNKSCRPTIKEINIFPSINDVISADPSEAIRSEEILPILKHEFTILEKKDWGGNIFQFLLSGIAWNFQDDTPESRSLLRMLLEIEENLLECGELQSDFAYIVAKPLLESLPEPL